MNALVDRRWDLEFMEYTEDYGMLWAMLAADFRAAGMFANAALCDRKAEYYMPTESGIRTRILCDPVIHENGQIIPITEPTRIYHNGTVEVVEPATVLVAEGDTKLTVTNHEYLRGDPKAQQVAYVEVAQ